LASSSIQEFSFHRQSVGASALWHEPLTCLHLLLFGEIKRKKGIIEVGFRIVSSLSLAGSKTQELFKNAKEINEG